MSVSMSVKAYRSGDDPEYQKKANAVKALRIAGVHNLPQELKDYFGIHESGEFVEGETGLEVASSYSKNDKGIFRNVDAEYCEIIEVDLEKLPKGTKFIRARLG